MAELTLIGHSEVVFNEAQQKQIGSLLASYSHEEITIVFREFYGRISTEYEARFAAKNFCEAAGALIDARRLELKQQQARQKDLARLTAEDRKREEERNAARAATKAAEPKFEDFDPLADE